MKLLHNRKQLLENKISSKYAKIKEYFFWLKRKLKINKYKINKKII
jgi:hypothetical protein